MRCHWGGGSASLLRRLLPSVNAYAWQPAACCTVCRIMPPPSPRPAHLPPACSPARPAACADAVSGFDPALLLSPLPDFPPLGCDTPESPDSFASGSDELVSWQWVLPARLRACGVSPHSGVTRVHGGAVHGWMAVAVADPGVLLGKRTGARLLPCKPWLATCTC